MTFKSMLYKALKYSNDINAVVDGQVPQRIERRVYGRYSTRLRNKLIPPRRRRRSH